MRNAVQRQIAGAESIEMLRAVCRLSRLSVGAARIVFVAAWPLASRLLRKLPAREQPDAVRFFADLTAVVDRAADQARSGAAEDGLEGPDDEHVILLQGSNLDGVPVYSYIRLTPARLHRLFYSISLGRSFRPGEMGTVVASGFGRPAPDVVAEMRRRYRLIDVPTSSYLPSAGPSTSPYWVDVDITDELPTAPPEPAQDRATRRDHADALAQQAATGDLGPLTEAIEILRAVAAETPRGPELAACQARLGVHLTTRYKRTGDLADVREAAELDRSAVALTPYDDPLLPGYLRNLDVDLTMLAERTGDPEVLAELVAVNRALLAVSPDGEDRSAASLTLAMALAQLADTTGDAAAGGEAVQIYRDYLASEGPDAPDRAAVQMLLAAALAATARHTQDAELLREAIASGHAAVAILEPAMGHAAIIDICAQLCFLFQLTGDPQALDEAIELGRATIATGQLDDGYRGAALNNIALAQRMRFAYSQTSEDERAALATARDAVASHAEGHPMWLFALHNLGTLQLLSYEWSGDAAMLDDAITVARTVAAKAPTGHSQRALCLVLLSTAMACQTIRTLASADLAESLEAARAAVAAAPEGHPDRGICLSNLSARLLEQYRRSGDLAQLREATAVSQAAVAACPSGHAMTGIFLGNLSETVRQLALESAEPARLGEAVELARRAVDCYPERHKGRGAALYALANALHDQFLATGDPHLGREAIAVRRAVIAASGTDRFGQAAAASGLGISLRVYGRRTGSLAHLREAVAVGRTGVASDRQDGVPVANLGYALLELAERGVADLLPECRQAFADAIKAGTSSIGHRIAAGRAKAQADLRAGDAFAALASIDAVVSGLSLVAPRHLARADRERRLELFGGTAGHAIAVAVAAGRPERAVQLAEGARGLLLAETMDTHATPPSLADAPDLAAALEAIRARFAALESPDVTEPDRLSTITLIDPVTSAVDSEAERVRQRAQASTDWDALLERIRARPGLADFPVPGMDELHAHAAGRQIVIVSSYRDAGHALLLTTDPDRPVRHLSLPGLGIAAVTAQVNRLRAARTDTTDETRAPSAHIRAQATILDVLAWLWDHAAGPILAELGHDRTPAGGAETWPRVWWCPVGVLAFLPLHAAGHHADLASQGREPRAVLDRVVSSYTATVRALGHSTRPSPDTAESGPMLVVAAPAPEGAVPLWGVTDEVAALSRLVPGIEVLDGPQATSATVLDALSRHTVVHFACHGISDWTEPANSRLVLHDDAAQPLTITTIARQWLPRAGLAFLSACATTDVRPGLVDEAVHITAAFQLAGYRHVIGTLWQVTDHTAAKLTHDVYKGLLGDAQAPDPERAAVALHNAVNRIRRRIGGATPTRWAAHIHTGP
ncbi:CHAT domain-containing protein [Phytohabitans houttuyneae]|uniref:CHAT domain-containing protein n=1 Tax=Phytohabitans houttuyneae TaxID=1076126 RepID=A0A6V8KGI9_9ACTN|nr:CHAT domain-containing protein [Phytohabitans houttuyneae]